MTEVQAIVVRGVVTDVDGESRLAGYAVRHLRHARLPHPGDVSALWRAMYEVALPATGSVWSCTVQRIRPKPPYEGPDDFEPFAVGYVDLGPVRVESRLEGKPVDEWRIGESSNSPPVRLAPTATSGRSGSSRRRRYRRDRLDRRGRAASVRPCRGLRQGDGLVAGPRRAR